MSSAIIAMLNGKNRSVTLSACDKDICLFLCLLLIFEAFFICLCIVCLFFSKMCLTVHFTYQGCSAAFVCVRACVYVRACAFDIELATSFDFQHAVVNVSFYCDDLMLPNCPFFILFLPLYFIFDID